MSTPRGIFEDFPNQTPLPDAPPASPFAFADESAAGPAPSPFAPAAAAPERRDSPFQISEPPDYGFEAPKQAFAASGSSNFDSYSIKQLELRAIFGVDRELTKEEIIQRSRSLPGIRHMALLSEQDSVIMEALTQVVSNLGFGNNPINLYSGSVPIEFIREGNIQLAVQTDGGFAPGVRESLMLVARELNK